jgi:hypothetical protein
MDRLTRIVEAVKQAKPDIFVSTGDLVDGELDGLNSLSNLLHEVKAPYGKFGITGNHEYYAGITKAIEFTERSGFRLLRDESVTIPGLINIAGVDDPAGRAYSSQVQGISERALLSKLPREQFTLFLKHRPVVENDVTGLFDLQLSGHVHKGQIFPFRLVTRLFFSWIDGLYHLPGNLLLYVSRGSGTWGPPMRFLAPPEVTVIELVHKAD